MKRRMTDKTFFNSILFTVIVALSLCALTIIIIDPLMHFHSPIKGLCYTMKDEFYLNPGIAAHYDYEAVVVGDSSCQNFLTSIIKDLWGYETVKLTNQGAPYKETDKILRLALKENDRIKVVFRAVDSLMLAKDPYTERYEESEYYLWDDNPFNDVKYLFNLEMLKKCFTIISDTVKGKTTWNMDMYSNWEDSRVYGSPQMLAATLEGEPTVDYSDYETTLKYAEENIKINVLQTIRDNPDVTFYLFMPPYHTSYWKTLMNNGTFLTEIQVEKIAIELLVNEPNVRLYSFMDDTKITTDWSYYCDVVHTNQAVNSRMLEQMYSDEGRLTADNYMDYLRRIEDYYGNYDYDKLYETVE